jgi:hypothetical protein
VLLLGLVLTAGATSSVGPYFRISSTFYVRPTMTFEVVHADATKYVGHEHWLSWGTKARANATLFTNTCVPSCAEGGFRGQAIQLTLSGLVPCRGKKVYSDFAIADRSGTPLFSGSFRSLGDLKGC